ncbi:MAG TPA: hypothetical protein VJT71_12535 [Pyrinomonadaceae bacterium]|nr:hypothetical protein [Pyrinomonadaceae bacterium]
MTILNQLATALNRRDEVPNQELAERIVESRDKGAVRELVENLNHKDKNIQSDCIKVLYEIGERRPELIGAHAKEFGQLLDSKNNRLVWGAMTALDSIAALEPKAVRAMLPKILAIADAGSVISRDHAVGILAKLAALKPYTDVCAPLLIEQLTKSPNNQLPMYAEKALPVIAGKHEENFRRVLAKRIDGLEKESQKKRLLQVLKKLERRTGKH